MAKKRNLAKSNLKDIPKKIREQQYATPLNGSAIGRKGLRVYDGGWIRIENGGLQVTGTAIISGTLNVTGIFNANGVNNLYGENHLVGPTDVAGNFEIIAGGQFKAGDSIINPDGSAQFGGLDISPDGTLEAGQFKLNPDGSADFGTLGIDADGVLTVRNDVNVEEGGEINVGSNMTLTPTNDGGSILFQDGSKVTSVGGVVQLIGAGVGAQVRASLNTAQFQVGSNIMGVDTTDWFAGNSVGSSIFSIGSDTNISSTSSVSIISPTVGVSGNLSVTGWLETANAIVRFRNLETTANAPNLYRNASTGRIFQSTWTP